MQVRSILVPRLALFFVFGALAACSSSSSPASTTPSDSGAGDTAATITEHGTFLDYFTLKPVAGLTVADNGASTTTDAQGNWSLTIPATSTLLQPVISGPSSSKLLFPDTTPTGTDVDHGTIVTADTQAIGIEQATLDGFDSTKALVQIVVRTTGSCASAVGGTITVTAPAGAKLFYFNSTGVPDGTLTSIQDVQQPRAAAVAFNITPGADLTVTIAHPTCTAVGYPFAGNGFSYTGKVRTVAAEPGDVNSALVVGLK
jgi:filamentous hemagglutinin family protein